MPNNNWYKGYCFRTRLHIKPYTRKRWWEAFWSESTGTGSCNVILIAASETSLKDVRQKARLWIEMDIRKKEKTESDFEIVKKEYDVAIKPNRITEP